VRLKTGAAAIAAVAVFAAPPSWAQDAGGGVAAETPEAPRIEDRGELRVDSSRIPMPDINFVETPEIAETYDKYFFFWREETSFETALADIRECDDYARGLSYHTEYVNPYAYGYNPLGVALGGIIGNALADKLYGSAERRKLRWQNLRVCMGYKEYGRYGLRKDLWEAFNFSEGMREVTERRRQVYLQWQAKVASGPRPAGRRLNP
jgi:hypothetical protein